MSDSKYVGRFLKKIIILKNGCWEWTGGKNDRGYGRFEYNGRLQPAHRFAYFYFYNEIDERLTIDHLCKNHSCVNPLHLQQITLKENILRGTSPPALNARKTHCPQGHSYSGENLYMWKNERNCVECRRIRCKEYQRKLRRSKGIVERVRIIYG